MADEQMQAGENQESAALQQILQLCQAGNPAALQEIAKIVQGLLSHNVEEVKEMGGEEGPSFRDQAMAAIEKQQGEQGA